MFTGIVEEIGEVISIDKNEKSSLLKIRANKVLEDTKIGDSISTNGVCLTITTKGEDYFTAYVMGETLRKSNLGNFKKSSKVNLERAMSINSRFNGHIVTGHIDSTGEIISFKDEGEAICVEIKVSYELSKYIVYKGSISIDGISLTIAEVKGESFKVSVIPHSQEETTLTKRKIGDLVNIECDSIGKYVEKLLGFKKHNRKKKSVLTEEFLTINGFI
ncbi:riboflavin synthase [Clostridium perfringens]|uniref:riboflavin synthase n=1 Tax=Clostridium perfringens TaxID=1502 RepID=UPI0013E30CE4|nr:riboflavin synthase [Clostridium perfringens]NGT58064.1 riboflavin synthase [Clostridium perfringens]